MGCPRLQRLSAILVLLGATLALIGSARRRGLAVIPASELTRLSMGARWTTLRPPRAQHYWQGVIRAVPGTDPATILALFGYPRGAAAPTVLGRNVSGPVALDRTWVYFVGRGAAGAAIQRLQRDGGMPETIVGAVAWWVTRLAVDDGALYWVEASRDARRYTVHRLPRGGGADGVLTQGDGQIAGLAVDARCVYWTNTATSSVGRVAHPGE